MYLSGPGVIAFLAVAMFFQLFTDTDLRSLIIGGLLILIVVFIPLYGIEYFKQNFRKGTPKKSIRFNKRNTRTEWEGGNIHGKVPKEHERPGKIFK